MFYIKSKHNMTLLLPVHGALWDWRVCDIIMHQAWRGSKPAGGMREVCVSSSCPLVNTLSSLWELQGAARPHHRKLPWRPKSSCGGKGWVSWKCCLHAPWRLRYLKQVDSNTRHLFASVCTVHHTRITKASVCAWYVYMCLCMCATMLINLISKQMFTAIL